MEVSMFKRTTLTTLALLAFSSTTLFAADPKEELQSALKNLTDHANYSWLSLTTDGDNAQGAVDGMTDKDGTTLFTLVQFQATNPAAFSREKVVVKMDNGKWLGIEEIAKAASEA